MKPLLCALLAPLALAPLSAAAGPRQADLSARTARPGAELEKPGGGTFYLDDHRGGRAAEVRIASLAWGRLVDVHDADEAGTAGAVPVHRQTVIREDVSSDGQDYRLEGDPRTGVERLVILRRRGAQEPAPGAGTFAELFQRAASALPSISADELSSAGSVTVPRNATVVVRLDDLLDDSAAAAAALSEMVRVATGHPPVLPFAPRVLFDTNYGGVSRGRFHSTRVLVDMTVSPFEAATHGVTLPVNVLGLPESQAGDPTANVALLIPTRVDPAAGQFRVLTNLAGAPLATAEHGPVELGTAALSVVRTLRAGNLADAGNGVLLDRIPPSVVGSWPATVDSASRRPGGVNGFDFLADLTFLSPCRQDPAPGDVLAVGAHVLVVTARGTPLQTNGSVGDVALHLLGGVPLASASQLLGLSSVHAPFSTASTLSPACWVSFTPAAAQPPGAGVEPGAQVRVLFSEPMDPSTFRPFDTFRLVRGDASQLPSATTLVVGKTVPAAALEEVAFQPLLPLAHQAGTADAYHVRLEGGAQGVTDLAGNPLSTPLPPVEFRLRAGAPEERNGGIVLRFAAPDEFQVGPAAGVPDVRGQFTYDLAAQLLVPRAVSRYGVTVDRTKPVPSLMAAFPSGVQTPLAPLGSKLQSLWRYCDLGWLVDDEAQYNVDVEGLSWSPAHGAVIADFFPEFEIRLAHGNKQPDEFLTPTLLPAYPNSGLNPAPNPYTSNVLLDPLSPQTIVHPRNLGYRVDPSSLYVSSTGTPLVPYPLNRSGAPYSTYTWRDTAVLARAGNGGAGIPLAIETEPPLQLYGGRPAGFLAPAGEVPSIGLPLLLEFRCYPTDTGLGLNALDVSLAVNSSARPNFRAFSTGGVGSGGQSITKNPDLETTPSGGFSGGQPTLGTENVSYLGELGVVLRVSRAHTIWLDTGSAAPDFAGAVVEAGPGGLAGTSALRVDFRGADGFLGAPNGEPFDADALDPYGDPPRRGAGATTVLYHGGSEVWSSAVHGADGARFVQMRISFVNDVLAGIAPEITSLAVAYEVP